MAEDRCCQKDPCAVTTSTPEPARRKRLRILAEQRARHRDCSGRSWWWESRSPSSPGSGRTPFTICRCAGSRPGLPFSAARPGCRSPTPGCAYSPKDTYLRAFLVGIVNTLRVAVIGIVLATVLGTMIGIARLSSNWLLSRLAAVYVEVLRDIPLLLQLLFWYVLMQGLPAARAAWNAGRRRLSFKSRAGASLDSDRGGKPLGDRRPPRSG